MTTSRSLARVATPTRPPPHVIDLREPEAVDARARVDDALPRPRRRLRQSLLGPPGVLVAVDVSALVLAGIVTGPGIRAALTFSFLLLGMRALRRAYRPRITMSALDDLPRAIGTTVVALGLTLAAQTALGRLGAARDLLVYAIGVFVLALLGYVLVGALVRARRRRYGPRERTLIVGTGTTGRLLGEALAANPQLGLHLAGFVAQADGVATAPLLPLPAPVLSGRTQDLTATISRHDISTLILAFECMPESGAIDTIIAAHQLGAAVLVVPHLLDLHHDNLDVERVRSVPLVRLRPDPTLRLSWPLKRVLDVVVAAATLLLVLPVLVVVSALVLIDSGRPVLFWQSRVGLDGRPFSLCKFRSMRPVPASESQATWTVTDPDRIGALGRFLRASSLDELPQLWNVLCGDMSLVGPRPERPTFVDRFSAEHERYWARHRVPVGLTGLAQVSGLRGDTSIADRARYDNYYIANWSLWLDTKIVLLTFREVCRGSGR